MRGIRRTALAVIFSSLGFIDAAVATDTDLQTLLSQCYDTSKPENQAFCAGRVTGVFQMMLYNGLALTHGEGTKLLSSCVSDEYPTKEDQLAVFLKWANSHPEDWSTKNPNYSETADVLGIVYALREAWPCQ